MCCAGDTGLGSWNNPKTLDTGESYIRAVTLTVPGVPAGNYYLVLRTDYWNWIAESNETNNDRATPITVTTPDLTVPSFTVPSSVTTQQAIPVNWTVTNQGTGTTQRGWTDAPFLSTDAVCCAGDTGLGSWGNVTALGPGASYTRTATFTIPNVAAGNYYLVVRADYWNGLYEVNETNNDRAKAITITH